MSECRVTCQTCRTENGRPKQWRWLCETCAEECADQHRHTTGHQVELKVIPDSWQDIVTAVTYANAVGS